MISNNMKNHDKKISRGYRLKLSTHSLIDELEKLMKTSKDVVITEAISILYKKVNRKIKKEKFEKEISTNK